MHAVILAAGEGSRLDAEPDVPKAFLEVGGRTLYDRQREALTGYVDGVTVVLGYNHRRVADDVGDARTVIVENWEEYDNAESLRRALGTVEDDVLVMNGDVVVTGRALDRLLDRHEGVDGHTSVVAALPPVGDDHTALRCDEAGVVTDYGLIEGYRHAGVGVLDETDLDAARAVLEHNREEWYPMVYPATGAKLVTIPSFHHVEINSPEDRWRARRRFPLPSPTRLPPARPG